MTGSLGAAAEAVKSVAQGGEFLAPVFAVLFILALPFWPVAIVVVTVAWVAAWLIERAVALAGGSFMRGATAKMTILLRYVTRPWLYFETPEQRAARQNQTKDQGLGP